MSQQTILSFRDLEVWQAAMDLAVTAFGIAGRLPSTQRFELASQIRRSATSVPSNVAEGHAHRGNRTYLRHVRIALGSLAELETQFELALRLEFIEAPGLGVAVGQVARTGQLLHGLERALKRRRLRNAISCLSLACGSVMTFVFVTLAILR
jgi:four helix bundle protein